MTAKLTVLIPCKDERRNIRACIDSVQGLADEILVADSGSTDGTLEIVRQIGGCRVIEREFVNYSSFKNWAIPQAKHEWVLLVDADERVTPQLADEIRQVLKSPPTDKDGFWIPRANHYLGYHIKHCGWNSDDVIRLFRRKCRYRDCLVHEEIDLPGERLGRLKQPFMHYTTWSSEHHLKKLIRYAQLGALGFRHRSSHPSALAMFSRAPLRFFQLYFLRLGFLDGLAGFQVCMHTAYYSFLKQAMLWELHHGLPQPDPEAERAEGGDEAIISFTHSRAPGEASQAKPQRRAA